MDHDVAIIGGACVSEELIPGFKFSTCANELVTED